MLGFRIRGRLSSLISDFWMTGLLSSLVSDFRVTSLLSSLVSDFRVTGLLSSLVSDFRVTGLLSSLVSDFLVAGFLSSTAFNFRMRGPLSDRTSDSLTTGLLPSLALDLLLSLVWNFLLSCLSCRSSDFLESLASEFPFSLIVGLWLFLTLAYLLLSLLSRLDCPDSLSRECEELRMLRVAAGGSDVASRLSDRLALVSIFLEFRAVSGLGLSLLVRLCRRKWTLEH